MNIHLHRKSTVRGALATLLCASSLAFSLQANAATDDTFLQQAVAGENFELHAAQVAQRNASSGQVKLLAYKIANDHDQSNRLRQLATMTNVPLPADTGATDDTFRQLAELHGAAFDKAYLKLMVAKHKADIAVLVRELQDGKDTTLKQIAFRSAQTLQEHLYVAEHLQAQLEQ